VRRGLGRAGDRGGRSGGGRATAALVRPDGVVAWASDTGATDHTATVAELDAALHRWAGAPSGRVEDVVPASTPG
jgi:aromatic ring hydroxylase-like protein